MLRTVYDPRFEATKIMADVLRDKMPEFSELLQEFDKRWEVTSRGYVQELEKILIEQGRVGDDRLKHDEVLRQIIGLKKCMAYTDKIFEMIGEFGTRLLSSQKANDRA